MALPQITHCLVTLFDIVLACNVIKDEIIKNLLPANRTVLYLTREHLYSSGEVFAPDAEGVV